LGKIEHQKNFFFRKMVQIWRKDSTFAGQFIADVKQTPKLKLQCS